MKKYTHNHCLKLPISLLLAIALLWPAQSAKPEQDTKDPQLIGACGVVILLTAVVVGGVVIYQLIKTCDRCLPKDTNKPPPDIMSAGGYYGTLVLEKSTNLTHWREIARTNASWNFQHEFRDYENPSGNAFYRTVVL